MLFIPFIFFLCLTVYWWKKHQGLDICVYMSGLYAITSFFAIIVVIDDLLGVGGTLFDDSDIELNFFPTILFCSFLALSILPFSLIYNKRLENIENQNPRLLTTLSCLLILVSLVNIYIVADSTLDILSGDLSVVRDAVYKGEETPAAIKAQSLPFVLKYLYLLNYATILSIPIFFYYLCTGQKAWWFKLLLLIASVSGPIAAIQSADRNEFVFYGMMFLFCIIFFWKMMTKKVKALLVILTTFFASVFLVYIIAVSMARFEERDEGASGSIMAYAGQGYLNFCYFWENANFDLIAPEREFPMTAHFLYKVDSDEYRRLTRSGQQGFFISVFPTFIGEIMLDLSPIGMIIWVSYYMLIVFLIIKRKERESFDIGEVLIIFTLGVIPVFGIFYYRFFFFTHGFIILIASSMYALSKFKIKLL